MRAPSSSGLLLLLVCATQGAVTPKPTRLPTLVPTAQPAVSLDWIVTETFEDATCSGRPFNVTGSRLHACLPLYTFRGAQPRGSYRFSSACVQGVSALYEEFSSTDCSGSATVTSSITSGACVSTPDPNSPDIFHVRGGRCLTGLPSVPPLPAGMVLNTQFGACDGSPPVAFSAFSSKKCNMNSATDTFAQIYALSSTFRCDNNAAPSTVGYLGTHCSKKSIQTSLSQTCGAMPGWVGSRYANAEKYSCTSPVPPPTPPTGWLTETYYDALDCSGPVLSVLGQATGVCTQGYGPGSVLMQSMLTKCEGTYVYNSTLDCTGPSVLLNPLPLGSCQPNAGGFGLRIGGSGAAYRVACTSDYANLPRPFGGNSIVLSQYNTDMCDGPATAFSKLPLEQPYQSTRYTQVVSCSTGVPVLSLSLGGLSIAQFSIFMSPDCSYLDQSLTTSSFLQRRTPSNPLGLVFFSSQAFSACPAVDPPTPTLTSVPAPNAQTTALINGLAAAVAVLAGDSKRKSTRLPKPATQPLGLSAAPRPSIPSPHSAFAITTTRD